MRRNHKLVRSLLALGLIVSAVSGSAIAEAAGSALTRTITTIKMNGGDNDALIVLSGGAISTPACQFAGGFVFDHTTARGKDLLQLATAALLSGKRVHALGTGTCVTTTTHAPPSSLVPPNTPMSAEVLDKLWIVQ
jgi:hypothetical protein